MKLLALRIDGFGALTKRSFEFAPGLNVVVGPNEAGKSTLAAAIVASLYGVGRRREHWRPWSGARYAATLRYALADGSAFEVAREFDRDPKGVRVTDHNGNDVTAAMAEGKTVAPGAISLRLAQEVFVNAACVPQQSVKIDADRAPKITATLAQALDGGPRDDAALGAFERLEAALRQHVGTERATKNAPLRTAIERAEAADAEASRARAGLEALGDLRARLDGANAERATLATASAEADRRIRAARALTLRTRLVELRAVRDEIGGIDEARAKFDDVAGFDAERVGELERCFEVWRERTARAQTLESEAAAAVLRPEEEVELEVRRADAGRVDDDAFAELEVAADLAQRNTARLAEVSHAATIARRDAERGAGALGAEIAAAALFAIAAIVVAVLHLWPAFAALAIVAVVIGFVAGLAVQQRNARTRGAVTAQRAADEAIAAERDSAQSVAAILDPIGVTSIDELRRRRERWRRLEDRRSAAEAKITDAERSRNEAHAAAQSFDELARELIGSTYATREEAIERARRLRGRRRERDGLETVLHGLEMRRDALMHAQEEFEIRRELDDLVRDGIEPAGEHEPSERALTIARAEIDERLRRAELAAAEIAAELRTAEAHVADLAALDDESARARAEIVRLETFKRAIALAKTTLEARTREAHEKFARRLEDYAVPHLAAVTGGRYREIFVDPADLTIKVRVASTEAIVDLEQLSVGTREQVYLMVRFAMARMFAEGLEVPPLVLDDPFATWDAQRIERCLPILVRGSGETQAIVLTASRELADAAVAAGATRFDLTEPAFA